MIHYDIIFIVLVYRNTNDLNDFFYNNYVDNSHTIVVISHYDDESDKEFIGIAKENNADVIVVENKGYGAGNNSGVEFALSHYEFDNLVISNADITIRDFDTSILKNYQGCIVAPQIIAASGKKQNPNEPYKPSRLFHNLMYVVYKHDMVHLIWGFYAVSKLKRIFYNTIGKHFHGNRIFSAHGSFVIIPIEVLKLLVPLYNEKMFLMNEETHLAMKASREDIKTVFVNDIVIDHKEDGSMSLEYRNEFPLLKQSFMEYYKYWYLDKD